MTSIRGRTSMLVAICMTLLLALGGVALFVVLRATLTRQFNNNLLAQATALRSLTRTDEGAIEMEINGDDLPQYKPGPKAEYFVAWVRDGKAWTLLERSDSLSGAHNWASNAVKVGTEDRKLPDGRAGRALTIEFVPTAEQEREAAPHDGSATTPVAPAPTVRLLVAQSREPLDEALAAISVSVVGVGIVLVLAGVAATSWAVRRSTRPLMELSRDVASLGPTTLHRRLQVHHLPSELATVSLRLNDLLSRLDEAFARERRFSSAASHELRTPIAELRMLLEVGLTQPRSAAEWTRSAHEALGVLDRAQRLSEALLRLSRADAAKSHDAGAQADLADVLRAQAALALAHHAVDPALIALDMRAALPACIDRTIAMSIIGNLLDNALRHGEVTADDPVRAIAALRDGQVCVTIANRATTLTADNIVNLFEPFWQQDAARQAQHGFGLGLAVGRALAESANGHLNATLRADWLEVTLCVPVVADDSHNAMH